MLEYFLETKEVQTLKLLEKRIRKAKGIVPQSVKDVLEILISDEKVDMDKIGSGNFYWSFPSKAIQKRRNEIAKLESLLRAKRARLASLEARQKSALASRVPTPQREANLAKLSELRAALSGVDAELSSFAKSDPKLIEEKKQAIRFCWSQTNLWIDNVFQVISFTKKKRPELKDGQILKHMGLPSELDYLPEPVIGQSKKSSKKRKR